MFFFCSLHSCPLVVKCECPVLQTGRVKDMKDSSHTLSEQDFAEAFLRMRTSYAAMQKCHDSGPDIDFDRSRIEFLKARHAYRGAARN
jgi:hypothetical protein